MENEEKFKIKCEKPIIYCEEYNTEACRYTCDYSIKMQSLESLIKIQTLERKL